MSAEPFIGEIKLFGGNFAMLGHAFCNGQIMPIQNNEALFALIGTTYGGDGQTTFALPDLRGTFPMGQGQGPGLSNRVMGQASGTESVTLIAANLPAHNHLLNCNTATGTSTNPANNYWAAQASLTQYATAPTASSNMKANAIGNAGNNQPHDNMDPYLTITYVIALEGIFPSRN